MASKVRMAKTKKERALCTAAWTKDVETLASLLQKGVYPNVWVKKRERMWRREWGRREWGNERERVWHIFFNVNILSVRCKILSPHVFGCGDDVSQAGAFVCESVWRTSALDREREEERERTKERRRERERERDNFLFLYSHFPLFRTRYASLQICFWTGSDDVATFASSSLSQSFSFSLYFSSTNTHYNAHNLSLSLFLIFLPSPSLSLPFLSEIFCVS